MQFRGLELYKGKGDYLKKQKPDMHCASRDIVPKHMPQDLSDDKSALGQLMHM